MPVLVSSVFPAPDIYHSTNSFGSSTEVSSNEDNTHLIRHGGVQNLAEPYRPHLAFFRPPTPIPGRLKRRSHSADSRACSPIQSIKQFIAETARRDSKSSSITSGTNSSVPSFPYASIKPPAKSEQVNESIASTDRSSVDCKANETGAKSTVHDQPMVSVWIPGVEPRIIAPHIFEPQNRKKRILHALHFPRPHLKTHRKPEDELQYPPTNSSNSISTLSTTSDAEVTSEGYAVKDNVGKKDGTTPTSSISNPSPSNERLHEIAREFVRRAQANKTLDTNNKVISPLVLTPTQVIEPESAPPSAFSSDNDPFKRIPRVPSYSSHTGWTIPSSTTTQSFVNNSHLDSIPEEPGYEHLAKKPATTPAHIVPAPQSTQTVPSTQAPVTSTTDYLAKEPGDPQPFRDPPSNFDVTSTTPPPGASTVAVATVQPATNHITFSPRTIVSPGPFRVHRERYRKPQHRGVTKREPPFLGHRGWTRELNERERQLLAEHTKLSHAQNDFARQQQDWSHGRRRETEQINRLRAELDSARQTIVQNSQQLRKEQDQLRRDTHAAHNQVLEANINITQQLQSLVTFTGHIRRITEAIEPNFPTPSIALGTVLNQIGYLVEERAIRKSFASAFTLYRLIAPALADLLTTLREHDNDLIPSISPPEVDLLRFRRAIGHIRMQLTDDEYTTIPGLPHPFFELHAADHLARHKQTPSPTFPTLNQPFHGFNVNSNDGDESTDDTDMEEAAGTDDVRE